MPDKNCYSSSGWVSAECFLFVQISRSAIVQMTGPEISK